MLYADSSAFIALLRSRDRDHELIREHYARLRDAGDILLTSNLALAETATRLRYDAGVRAALTFREFLERATASSRLVVRYSDADLDAKAWSMMERYSERSLSFPDCVGAVTAREGRASAVFGLDTDFTVLGFALEP